MNYLNYIKCIRGLAGREPETKTQRIEKYIALLCQRIRPPLSINEKTRIDTQWKSITKQCIENHQLDTKKDWSIATATIYNAFNATNREDSSKLTFGHLQEISRVPATIISKCSKCIPILPVIY
jgi:hypothetical protein